MFMVIVIDITIAQRIPSNDVRLFSLMKQSLGKCEFYSFLFSCFYKRIWNCFC